MIKKLITWLTNILRAELERTEQKCAAMLDALHSQFKADNDAIAAEVHRHVTKVLESIQRDISTVRTDLISTAAGLTAHVTQEVEKPTEALKAHISAEISAQFDKILAAASVAAKTSLGDARKALRMPCNFCSKMSWMFTVLEKDGRILCNDCKLKGLGN